MGEAEFVALCDALKAPDSVREKAWMTYQSLAAADGASVSAVPAAGLRSARSCARRPRELLRVTAERLNGAQGVAAGSPSLEMFGTRLAAFPREPQKGTCFGRGLGWGASRGPFDL